MKTLLPLALMLALAAAPAAATAKTLVSFEQSGGIAGVSVTVAVSTTGHVTGDVKGGDRSHRLRAATLRHLRRAARRCPLGPREPGADRTARTASPTWCATTATAPATTTARSRQVPRSVRAVVAELLRISRGGR